MRLSSLLLTVLLLILWEKSLLALPKTASTVVKNSDISNINKDARIAARNRSIVNTGIQARQAKISNSKLSNRFSGNINANNHANVTTGIKADGATIKNSTIAVDTKAAIRANNATVKTGVDISGAKDATIKTRYRGKINAVGAVVKAGVVEGDVRHKNISTNVTENINARGRGVKIGTVSAGNGHASRYMERGGLGIGPRRQGASIGNVTSRSNVLRKVDTEVGSGNFIKGIKTRHLAKFYEDTGGVDPTGTKHVFVSKKDKKRAEKRGGSVGNSHITNRDGGRRVNPFVE